MPVPSLPGAGAAAPFPVGRSAAGEPRAVRRLRTPLSGPTGPAPRTGRSALAGRGQVPRYLHPLAWWGWALGLMLAASRTTDPLLLALVIATLALVVTARRPAAPWAGAFSAALRLGVFIIAARTILQGLIGPPMGIHVAIVLPEVDLPDWMAGVRLGGIVTWESLVIGMVEGLRLATMIACVGAANSLTAPSRLLRSVPAALYELGLSVVVALTFAPRLLMDARRVRGARRLRGHHEGRLPGLLRSIGPVLDGSLERSIQLAAAMDSRGYGRSGPVSARERRTQAVLVLSGFAGVLIGLFALFDASAPGSLGWPLVGLGALACV
ncbi:MAG: energy-coupling factor transporter transmembrane component T, partial [Candidatus Nanopelagicales bacterium]